MKKTGPPETHNKTICFFNTNKAWGGGEKWHLEYACGLRDRGYPVCIIAYRGSPLHTKALESGIQVFGLKLNNFSFVNIFHLRAIKKILRHTGSALVIFNLARDLKAGGLAARQVGIRCRIYRRGSAIPVKNTFLNRYIFKNIVTEIISNSEETTRTLTRLNPAVAAKKITVIYNGIDTGRFPATERKVSQDRPLVIGNAGRLSPQKAQHHLIELAGLLKAKGTRCTIRVAGDGELREALTAKTRESNLHDTVQWEGFKSNIKEFLDTLDIFILTSHWEGFGYVLIEAMLCGLPVIAFNTSSNPEIVKHGETGVLIPPYDIDKLAETVERLRTNPAEAREMGRKGRARALDLFDFQKALDRLETLLHNPVRE
jgi:glycosyltransferase involved in cell wall biosynthesis